MRFIYLKLIGLLFLISLPLQHGMAQDQSEDGTKQPPENNVTRDQLSAMIANEVLLAPGVGLRNIRIGEPLVEVQDRLGPPVRIRETGVIRKTYILYYELDGGTRVVISGKKQVENILVSGTSAALVRTVQGARFGMDRSIIQRIYRNPTKSRKDRLEYRNRGVTFFFADSGVDRISLYARGG